ncbi:MAG: hypothetical protein U0401_00735 [Anaerolineae bacterium]
MILYPLALFLHIVGALGLFTALSLEWASLWQLRRAATVEQIKQGFLIFAGLRRLYSLSWITILLAGFYMAATVWGWVAWIGVALAGVVLIGMLGDGLSGRRLAAIEPMVAAAQGALSPDLRQHLGDPLLWLSIQTRVAIALGIVFLMTVKPGLTGALLTLGVAVTLGLAAAWPTPATGLRATIKP